MCSNAPVGGLLAAAIGLLVAFALFNPTPPLSQRLQNWQSQGQFFLFKGHNVFYKDVKGSGIHGTVICLHGFPTFSWDWSKVLPGLQSQFSRVIMLDFLGFGFSDKPASHSFSIFEQADIVTRLAETLSAPKVHLLSHDYGDTVALELLSRYNKALGSKTEPVLHLQSLTMLNGGVFPETNNPRLLQKLLLIPVLGPALGRLTFYSLFKIGFGEIFGNKPTEMEITDFYAGLRHNNGHHVTASLLQYIPDRRANKERWVGALKESQIPVLMIYGPADPVNPPHFVKHFRKEAARHQIVVLEDNIGHYPQWEDPDSTLQHMEQFLHHIASKQTI